MSNTLIYTPGIQIVIATEKDGMVDVSEDLLEGSLTLNANGGHRLSFSINNTYRKYDGVFTPNDRIVVQMKRLSWLQVFSGYLNEVPYYSTFPKPVSLTAECTLKVLRHWAWDARSGRAYDLIHGTQRNRDAQDGGIADVIENVISTVVGWPKNRIHIGKIPSNWYDKFQSVYERIADDATSAESILGNNPIIAGEPVGSTPGSIGSGTRADTSIPFAKDDMDVVLATIRQIESGNNYKAINRGDGNGDIASGAYQFVTSTWNNYRGYSDAYLAPPAVQDAKATEYANYIFGRYGNLVVNIPYGWYYPKVFSDPSLLDKIPAANEGNALTIRQYGEKWLGQYVSMYEKMKGRSPATTTGGAVAPTHDFFGGQTGSTPSSGQALYPIPAGVDRLNSTECAWGGFSNGKIPQSAMRYTAKTGYGHPAAIESYTLMLTAAEAAGHDIRGWCYRDYATQAAGAASSSLFAKAGSSNHGWGLAIDITELAKGSASSNYAKPMYAWLRENAWKYGWGHPVWAQDGGTKEEPWHWEFLAFSNFKDVSTANPGDGANPFADPTSGIGGGFDGLTNLQTSQLFQIISWWEGDRDSEVDPLAETYAGLKATMNDSPILETVQGLVRAAGREFCSAPNGDFISWFPDYWGEFDMAGRVNVELIELQDFSVMWNDASMITHQFVEGSYQGTFFGPLPQGIRSAVSAQTTRGVATVEIPRFLESVVNMGTDEYPWLSSPDALLSRFGARISRQFVPEITGGPQEFWFATQMFIKAWASMFRAQVPLTFMPELFPGMLLCIPDLGVQFYVNSVTHSWDFTNDSGFRTTADTMSPSTPDGSGFFLFPKGGTPPARSSFDRSFGDVEASGSANAGVGGSFAGLGDLW